MSFKLSFETHSKISLGYILLSSKICTCSTISNLISPNSCRTLFCWFHPMIDKKKTFFQFPTQSVKFCILLLFDTCFLHSVFFLYLGIYFNFKSVCHCYCLIRIFKIIVCLYIHIHTSTPLNVWPIWKRNQ